MLSSMKPATSFPTCRPVSFSHACKKSCRRQLRKRSDPHPRSRDALTVSSDRLAFIGRSTAVELHDKKGLIHKVPLGDSVAFVLPRTLLEWRQAHSKKDSTSASDDDAGSWEEIPGKSITLSKAKARLIVQMAVELDCTKLQSLWTKAKVWQAGALDSLDFATWLQHRERFVVVLTGPIADRYWMVGQKDLYLCACKYFAVSGRCEHEQCIHYMLGTGNIDLRVVGSKGGRPLKPVSSNRGWSSAALHWTREREQECELQRKEAKRQATAFAPQPPARISPGQATDALSDAAAQTCRQTEAEATAVAAAENPPAARALSGMAEEAAAPKPSWQRPRRARREFCHRVPCAGWSATAR